jgi:hypothetical protein
MELERVSEVARGDVAFLMQAFECLVSFPPVIVVILVIGR